MSWWSDIASKAEDLLNRVDQTAATALQNDKLEPGSLGMQRASDGDDGWRPASERVAPPPPRPNAKPANESAWYYGGPSKQPQTRKSPPPGPPTHQPPRQNSKDREAALFDFLNSSEPKQKERPRSAMSNKPSHSRRSSASSTKSESVIDFSSVDDGDFKADNRNGPSDQQFVVESSQDFEEKTSESFYAALKNDFSKTEIKRTSSMSSTPVIAQEADSTSPAIVEETATDEVDVRAVFEIASEDDVLDGLTAGEKSSAEVESVESETASVESTPTVEEMQNSASVEFDHVEAQPDLMTTSFQNPYADPEPSVQSEPTEPEPERSPTPPRVQHDEATVALKQKVSSLELENKLLRSEVASLNTEIVSVVQRDKATQQELLQLSQQSGHLLQLQSALREFESRECDYRENLKAKDHQIGVLRVRLEELDNEIAGKNQAITILESERERIMRDHSDTAGVQTQAMESMRGKLMEVENSYRREQDALRQIQRETMERQTKSEDDQRHLSEQLQVIHKKLLDEKNKNVELNNQLRTSKQSVDTVQQELGEYKEKAARILQSKDKLITSLRDNGAVSPDVMSASSISSELEEVRQERDMYKEELQVMSMNMDRLKQEMADLESQMQTDGDQARDTITQLEEQFDSEKRKREECEQEILKQKQELRYAHEEILQQRVTFQTQLTHKDGEIERISGQLSSKMTNNTSQAELENRLRALTESLIQKQTMLENISTEKTSLTLQLERMERRFRDNETLRTQAAAAHVNIIDDSDSTRNRLPLFLNETNYDTHVTRGMKRAANSLDKFSIRLGVFLRRYPIARVMVIMYMFMLHLWVSIVLLTYQPEMHGEDFSPKAPHHEH